MGALSFRSFKFFFKSLDVGYIGVVFLYRWCNLAVSKCNGITILLSHPVRSNHILCFCRLVGTKILAVPTHCHREFVVSNPSQP